MNKPVIGIDCDLVLSASDKLWWKYLHKITGCIIERPFPEAPVEYNLSNYWKASLEASEQDGMAFWKSNLYDWVDTVEGSQEALYKLKRMDFEIVIVSACKSGHEKSKYQFIKRNFPFIDGVLFTREKHYAKVDVFVDDRVDVLNKMPLDVECIRLDTVYIQSEEPTREILVKDGWDEIFNYLEGWYS